MKTQKTYALFHILFLGLLLSISTTAYADERTSLFELHMVENSDGLVTNEPRISQPQLNDALIENKYLVNVRSNKLKEFIEENRITAQTGIMAAVMPGGLVYLAWRKTQINEANDKLENLQKDISNLQSDVLALRIETNPVLVARFP